MVNLRNVFESGNAFPRTIFVHMGTANRAEEFFSEYWPDAQAIGDPKQTLCRAFGVGWGSPSQFFNPAVWSAYLRAKSFGVGMPHGNTMRNPGAILIHNQQIRFAQEFEHFGVQVDIDAVRDCIGGDDLPLRT